MLENSFDIIHIDNLEGIKLHQCDFHVDDKNYYLFSLFALITGSECETSENVDINVQ